MTGMLSDIKVLDLTTFLSGPFCTMILADMGAEVIKIETPPKGCATRGTPPFVNGESAYFMSLNRGKKDITLNLKSKEGKKIFLQLAAECDVLVENFRPGVMERLGFDYETMSKLNPKLVYATISGFGSTGPLREKGAYDMVIQGYGGVMSITGNPGEDPIRVGYSVADLAAGLYGAIAVTGALRARDRMQKGQHLDISMFDCQVALMENAIARYFATGEIPGPLGNRHPSIAPFQAFKSSTGYFTVTASTDEQFGKLCDVLEVPGFKSDPRFLTKADRAKNAPEVSSVFGRLFEGKPKEHWIERLDGCGVPCGPINNVQEVVESPQVQARGMIVEMDHPTAGKIKMAGSPIKASLTPVSVQCPPPLLGQDTEKVLARLGYGGEEIAAFKTAGII
ncbi:MAG: CaiB/BaiF CoA-transferase family protein [Deltaproteobacteria bacterium]|nr:CaiB/BaiF CoA-transferase family protein [Deltaproteobacteria bacterium]